MFVVGIEHLRAGYGRGVAIECDHYKQHLQHQQWCVVWRYGSLPLPLIFSLLTNHTILPSGVLAITAGEALVSGSQFLGNSAQYDGGVFFLYSGATLNVISSLFRNNSAENGKGH